MICPPRASRIVTSSIAALLFISAVIPLATTATAFSDGQSAAPPSCEEPQPPASLPSNVVAYRTLSGREAQVTFTSPAPLERIVGKSNGVVGFALSGPQDQPAQLAGATWVLPVASLATGLPLRDEHMSSSAWLDAEAHPVIRFVLMRVEDVRELKRGEGFSTWSATLVGMMTLHGVTRELRVPGARLSFLKQSERTRSIAPGDLLFVKCDYAIRLSDFGIRNSDVPEKVADTVELNQMLRLSNASPDEIRNAAASPATQAPASTAPPAQAP